MRRTLCAGKRPYQLLTFLGLTLLISSGWETSVRADDWPQWLGPKRDGVWREKGILEKFPANGPKELWRTPIGAGYSGPAVADGRVFITDRILAEGATNPKSAFDGDTVVPGKERVLCLDEKTGKILWKWEYDCPYQVQYPAGPRCTPLVSGDKVYTLGAMGDLYCLDVNKGKVLWSKNLRTEYNAPVQLWGFSGHPLMDGNRLICLAGGPNSLVIAFDKDTGKEIWKNLTVSGAGYVPPMIYEIGGKRQLIIWHAEGIHSLVPETGDINWNFRHPKKGTLKVALCISTPRLADNKLFFTAFYQGPLMLQLDKQGSNPQVAWQGKSTSEQPDRTDGLHSIMSTPFIKDGYIYGVCSYGELRCLDAKTGQRLWFTREPTSHGKELRWANAFLIQHEERVFLFNELGELIIAHLSPKGYQHIGTAKILPPTNTMAGPKGRLVLWSHPAFANRNIYARNDQHIVCVSLAKEEK